MTTPKSQGDSPKPATSEMQEDAAWGNPAHGFHRWPALFAILAALALYVTLPARLYFGPSWVLPAVEIALMVALLAANQLEEEGHELQRGTGMTLTAAMSLGNLGSLILLVHNLLTSTPVHGVKITASSLMMWSAQIWLTNVLVFGLWYWELDRGGPIERTFPHHPAPDFLFPQMANPDAAPPDWCPSFFDYLYTSFTNAAAFSPTDTMPLSEWAKALFMIQSLTSITTEVLVIARIANILP